MRIKAESTLETMTLVQTLEATGAFKVFVQTLRATGIIDVLRDSGRNYTVFAPNDAAFKKLALAGQLQPLLKDHALLTRTVNLHIVPARVMAGHIDGRTFLPSREGRRIIAETQSGFRIVADTPQALRSNAATIIRPDIECANGIIHEIDTVLKP